METIRTTRTVILFGVEVDVSTEEDDSELLAQLDQQMFELRKNMNFAIEKSTIKTASNPIIR